MKRPFAVALTLVALTACGQKTDLKLTTEQHQRLELAQKDAIIANNELQHAQAEFNKSQQAFAKVCDTIKTENKWDVKVQCNIATLEITEPQPAAATPTAPTKK